MCAKIFIGIRKSLPCLFIHIKLYQLPQVANEHDLPKDELKERIGVREKYIELKEKYENEFGTAFPSGVYLDFTRHKHNIL